MPVWYLVLILACSFSTDTDRSVAFVEINHPNSRFIGRHFPF